MILVFLKQLYLHWRMMFYFFIFFLLSQLFFTYKGIESVPFYLSTMYSGKYNVRDTTYKTDLYVNGKWLDPDKVPNRTKEILMGSFDYFEYLKWSHFIATDTNTIRKRFRNILPSAFYHLIFERLTNTKVDDRKYINWLARYLQELTGEKIGSIAFIRHTIVWKPKFSELNDSAQILSYTFKDKQ